MIEDFRHDRLTTFAGLPVIDFCAEDPDELEPGRFPPDVEAWAWRVGIDGEDSEDFPAVFELFLETVDTTRVKALILGNWCEDGTPDPSTERSIGPLMAAASRFPSLEALFFPDMDREEAEVSWIEVEDPGPMLALFPRLRWFGLRGTTELRMEPLSHDTLEELTFQGGGLPSPVVGAIAESRLPALTGLDLYLGTPQYGGGATAADLERILQGEAFPSLRHLGLRNAENVDDLAAALARAPIVARLASLDLSLGALTDDGAAALLSGQPLTHLAKLDLHHHYLSEEMMQRIWQALPGVEVNLDEAEGAKATRYIAVTE
jgi:hypothetical protein